MPLVGTVAKTGEQRSGLQTVSFDRGYSVVRAADGEWVIQGWDQENVEATHSFAQ